MEALARAVERRRIAVEAFKECSGVASEVGERSPTIERVANCLAVGKPLIHPPGSDPSQHEFLEIVLRLGGEVGGQGRASTFFASISD